MADDQITVLTALPADTDSELLLMTLAASFEVVGRHHSLDTVAMAAVELVPDVLLVHDTLGRDGFPDLARRLNDEVPVTRMVALTDNDDDLTYEMVRNGVFSVVSTRASIEEIVSATRSAGRRESVLSAGVARHLVDEMTRSANMAAHPANRPPSLTLTEREVLTLIARDKLADEIASMYDVTARLVNLHTGYAVAKLQQHLAQQRKLVNNGPSRADSAGTNR
ncbi:MAG: LuxR C-terminal-related transcriptional regulator [Acidimicrobiales bacterium]